MTFKFSDYTIAVRLEGAIARTSKIYRYTIVPKTRPNA